MFGGMNLGGQVKGPEMSMSSGGAAPNIFA